MVVVHVTDCKALLRTKLIVAVETCKTNQPMYNQLDYNQIFKENQMQQRCMSVIEIRTYDHLHCHWISKGP